MIHIYIESGIKRSSKGTTNEYDFIEKFISLHFPDQKIGIDYQLQGWDGKDRWHEYQPILQQQTDRGDKNILIFDADCLDNDKFSIKSSVRFQTGLAKNSFEHVNVTQIGL